MNINVTPEEFYLVEKARALREQKCAFVTTSHGVLMTYEEHQRLLSLAELHWPVSEDQ